MKILHLKLKLCGQPVTAIWKPYQLKYKPFYSTLLTAPRRSDEAQILTVRGKHSHQGSVLMHIYSM